MSYGSEKVKKFRRLTKERMVNAMGGKCCCCKYSKCLDALEFHHIDPSQKEFSFSRKGKAHCWNKIVKELKKCVLVCCRCHREIHANIRELPKEYPTFDEKYEDYRGIKDKIKTSSCPICGKEKPIFLITCSKSCAAKKSRKVDWDSIDLELLIKNFKTNVEIAKLLGISDSAVKKRRKKIGI